MSEEKDTIANEGSLISNPELTLYSRSTSQPNYIQIDNYQIDKDKILGTGGFATVYLGYYAKSKWKGQEDKNALFAIKEISINSEFEITNSLVREINVLRHLKNKNIIQFIDAKITDNHFYLIMEYCSGGTLDDFIRNNNNLTESLILKYYYQIVYALQYLHTKKIFHRDIKPKNILLHNQQIKLVDFGLSKILADQNINATIGLNTCVGTPQYMAPEMLRGEGWDEKSDIWSLGLTLYFMIFQDLPWDSNSNNSIMILESIEKKLGKKQDIEQEGTISSADLKKNDSKDNSKSTLKQNLPIGNIPRQKTREELQYLLPDGKSMSDYYHIQTSTLRLLDSMLQVKINNRLNWKTLFEIPQFQEYHKKFNNDELKEELKKSHFKEVTPQSLIVTQDGTIDNQEELRKHGAQWNQHFDEMKKEQELCEQAKTLIEFELKKARFFDKVSILLKEQYMIDIHFIPKDLYIKCQFLLYKRANIILSDLSKMMAFRLNSSGSIHIDEQLWKAITSNWDQTLCENVIKENTYYEKKFSSYQIELNQVYKKLENFDMVLRGDAYTQNLDENLHLIQAYNDNFLKLFQILAEKAFILRKEDKLIGKKNSQIMSEFKLNIIFIYLLMIVLSFRNTFTNYNHCISLDKFYENIEKVGCIELLIRIEQAYKQWQPMEYDQM